MRHFYCGIFATFKYFYYLCIVKLLIAKKWGQHYKYCIIEMKYYVTVDFEKEPVLRTDDFKEAKAFAKDLVKDETHLESRVYTDGTNEFVSFYNPFIKNRYGVHLTLNKQREIGFFLKPSLKNEESAYYNSDRDELYIARELIAEHPKFETIESFANFVQCYLNHSKK